MDGVEDRDASGAASHDDDPFVTEFLLRYQADVDSGTVRDQASYQAMFPGREAVIAREYAALMSAPSAPATAPSIGPYCLLRPLGRGGYGEVYLAEDTRLNRRVALKVQNVLSRVSADRMERFQREGEILARLDHPGLASVFDVGEDRGLCYLAMRFVDGRSLASILEERGDRPPTAAEVTQAVAYVEQAARALHVAHGAAVVHRDIKPANLMITPADEVVVVDFGLARDLNQGDGLTRSYELFGTLGYLAPEQVGGGSAGDGSAADPRVDVHALGVVLYEATTGTRPFQGASVEELLSAIRLRSPVAPRSRNGAISVELDAVIRAALEKDLDRRYGDALALADDLRRVRMGEPVAARPSGLITRLWLTARRERRLASLIAVVLALLVVTAALGGYLIAVDDQVVAARRHRLQEQVEAAIEDGFRALGDWRYTDARASFEAALRLAPRDPEALAGLARALLGQDRPSEVLAFLEEHATELPGLASIAALRESATRQLAGAEESEPSLDDATPGSAFDAFLLGLRELRRAELARGGSFERALGWFDQAILMSDRARPIFHFERARAAGRAGDPEQASSSALALATLWPDSSSAAFFAGFALQGVGLGDQALPHFERAVALDPSSVNARLALASSLQDAGRFAEALPHYERVLAVAPDDATAHFCLAMAAEADGDLARAAKHYQVGLRGDPTFPAAHAGLVGALRGLGDDDALLRELRRWTEVMPQDASGWCDLALEIDRRADADERLAVDAAAAARRAIDLLGPDLRDASGPQIVVIARALLRIGDPAEAAALLPALRRCETDESVAPLEVETLIDRAAGLAKPVDIDERRRDP